MVASADPPPLGAAGVSDRAPPPPVAVRQAADQGGAVAAPAAHPATPTPRPLGSTLSAARPVSFFRVLSFCDAADTALLAAGAVGAAGAGAGLPLFSLVFGTMLDVVGPGATTAGLAAEVSHVALRFLYLALGSFAASYLEVSMFAAAGARLARRMRLAYLGSALRQEVAFYDTGDGMGALLQGLEADANDVQTAVGDKLGNTIHNAATFCTGVGIAFWRGWDMTLVMLSVMPLLGAAGAGLAVSQAKLAARGAAAYAVAGTVASEALSSVRTVASFNAQPEVLRQYDALLAVPEHVSTVSSALASVTLGCAQLIFLSAYAIALYYGWTRVRLGAYTGGQVMNVLFATLMGGLALGQAVPNLEHFQRARAAGGRLLAVIRREPRIGLPSKDKGGLLRVMAFKGRVFGSTASPPAPGSPSTPPTLSSLASQRTPSTPGSAQTPAAKRRRLSLWFSAPQTAVEASFAPKGEIALRNVTFAYPSRPGMCVLDGLTMRVAAGDTVALVGPSGSGKSTVIQMLLRLYDPDRGVVELDGVNIRGLDVDAYRSAFGLVSQEPTLFSASVRDNIRYGRPAATDSQVEAAAQAAGAHSFITTLPQGYDTLVGERGSLMSGGQRQRIAIARAIVRDPKILLLDEATSALDAASERAVQDALTQLRAGRTTVVVAHRLSTIVDADGIIVLRSGKGVEGPARHADLMAAGGEYASLVRLQLEAGPGSGGEGNAEDGGEGEDGGDGGKGRAATANTAASAAELGPTPAAAPAPFSASLATVVLQAGGPALPRAEAALSPRSTTRLNLVAKAKSAAAHTGRSSFVRLAVMNKREWPWAAAGVLGSAVLGFQMPAFALVLAPMLNIFFQPPDQAQDDAVMWTLILVSIGVGAMLASILRGSALGYAAARMTRRLRRAMLQSALGQEVAWFDRDENSSGALATRLSADAAYVRGAVGDSVAVAVQVLVSAVGGLAIAFANGWKLSLVILATIPAVGAAGVMQGRFMAGFSSGAAALNAVANQLAAEALAAPRTVAAFGMAAPLTEAYGELMLSPVRQAALRGQANGLAFGSGQFSLFAVYALAFWYGGTLVSKGEMTFESMLKVFFALIMSAFGLVQAQIAFPDLSAGSGAVTRSLALIDRAPAIDADAPGTTPDAVDGAIQLQDVHFAYPARPDAPVLAGFSLAIAAGTTVALVGPSGGGKSTVLALLERFYDPDKGAVYLDGIDIRSLSLRWLRSVVAMVGQEPVLFSGTIRDNVCYGRLDASDADVRAALDAAAASEFVDTAPEGWHTRLGAGGMGISLSGGQKQRIAIARALVKQPKVLLLDEATSALDASSEALVQTALFHLTAGRTTLVVAHRLSTVVNADAVAVCSGGRVVEVGPHAELLAAGGAFAALAAHQAFGTDGRGGSRVVGAGRPGAA